jgi:hypothetical protein
MKKILTIILCMPLLLIAQFNTKGYKVETGDAYKVIDGSKHYFNQGNDVMMVKFTKKDIVIQKFDITRKKKF